MFNLFDFLKLCIWRHRSCDTLLTEHSEMFNPFSMPHSVDSHGSHAIWKKNRNYLFWLFGPSVCELKWRHIDLSNRRERSHKPKTRNSEQNAITIHNCHNSLENVLRDSTRRSTDCGLFLGRVSFPFRWIVSIIKLSLVHRHVRELSCCCWCCCRRKSHMT